MKNLIIVESPAKAKTIERILGKDYKVVASFGHVRDLPKNNLGVDVENDYAPKYIIPLKAKKTIRTMKDMFTKSKNIYLASDLDREGEAIAWHIVQAIKPKKDQTVQRVIFPAITKSAVELGMKNPREIDLNLVDAQQARRVLDRLVGYKLSPLLWKKIFKGLSAGRVQSVALRLIVEREREIQKFVPEEYWTVEADFSKVDDETRFLGKMLTVNGKKFEPINEEQAAQYKSQIEKSDYKVGSIKVSGKKRNPYAPFITSTLQQEAYKKLHFTAKKTMMLAQKLYEGVEVEGKHLGLITYMRTDSRNISGEAIDMIRKQISKMYGEKYLPEKPVIYKKASKLAQEAHEAIRVTYPNRTPDSIDKFLDKDLARLYQLIWKRTMACQMKPAEMENTAIDILGENKNDVFLFRANGTVVIFNGFLEVWDYKSSTNDENFLPKMEENENLVLRELFVEQHFTQPPPRFTDATLVKELEKNGVGRPSTYASIMSTIQVRGYVEKEEGKFKPTDTGFTVNDFLVKHFSDVVDVSFTAKMENELDEIALGKKHWVPVIDDFYKPFIKNISEKEKEVSKEEVVGKMEETDEKCPDCGSSMQVKMSRYGKFLACTGYPKCKYTKPLGLSESDQKKEAEAEPCEKCGSKMVIKKGRFGSFLACSNYPKCKNIRSIAKMDLNIDCPKCQKGKLVEKRSKRGKVFYACNRYPECDQAVWNEPTDKKCEVCGFVLTKNKSGSLKCEQCAKSAKKK